MIGWKCLTSTSTKMTRTLFLGDSHSHGYFEMGGKVNAWESNNYAELYALENNKQTVMYSMPGGCNRKYPAWLRTMLDRYNDIDEVFVQSHIGIDIPFQIPKLRRVKKQFKFISR